MEGMTSVAKQKAAMPGFNSGHYKGSNRAGSMEKRAEYEIRGGGGSAVGG